MNFINVNWAAPSFVRAVTTQQHPNHPENYNVATHVHDDLTLVMNNRHRLQQTLGYPSEPFWLNQTHSNTCINIDQSPQNNQGDASYTQQVNKPLVILTADCLPILISHQTAPEIAAIHAGWRGLANGIIENTLAQLSRPAHEYCAWLGPAICQKCYAVGDDLRDIFLNRYEQAASCFYPSKPWNFSLTQMARCILNQHDLQQIDDVKECTFENPMFYSYRRQAQTGRIATLIWIKDV